MNPISTRPTSNMASRTATKSPKTPKSKSPLKRTSQPDSPNRRAGDSPKGKPTCDVARRLRDVCATWHECVQKWENLTSLGTNVANKLTNLQLQKQVSDVEDSKSVTVLRDLTEAAAFELEDEIVKTSQELSTVLLKLAEIFKKMESLSTNFKAAKDLKELKDKDEYTEGTGYIFNTWKIDEFCTTSDKLVSMYGKELSLKEKLYPYFTSTQERNTLMVYLALWLHKPYLDDDHDVLLESMLVETELR